jgi:uncharacterized protein YjbI with pentapeptide repeats/beta-lactamase regulating signal transducer with metallopeptidase domain
MNRVDLIDSVARTVAGALGVGILEAAGLAAVVFAIVRFSRPSATTRHVLWWIALCAGIALPAASIAGSLGRIEHRAALRSALAPASPARHPWRALPQAAIPMEPSRHTGTAPQASAPAPAPAVDPFEESAAALGRLAAVAPDLPHVAAALVAVWLAFALAGLGLLARSLFALRAIKRAALPLDESVARRLRRWRHSTRLGRQVELRVSSDVDVPVAVGFKTPTILLPVRVVETEEIADIDQIVMHEYAHLNRYDDWSNLVQRAIERVFWFNPVVLLLGRQISLEREIACDDWVIAQTGRAHRYATCLWKLVESARLPAKPIVAPGALLSPKQITTRIEQLLDSRRNALPRLSPLGAIALGALGVVLVVVQAQRAPVIAIEDMPSPPVLAQRVAAHMATVAHSRATAHAAAVTQAAPAAHAAAAEQADAVERVASIATPAPPVAPRRDERVRAFAKKEVARSIRAVAPGSPGEPAIGIESSLHQAAASVKAAQAVAAAKALDGASAGIDIGKTIAAAVVDAATSDDWTDRDPRKLDRETIAHCFGCNLRGRDLRGIDLHGIALNGDDLRGADLRGVDLSDAKLLGVDLRDAKLDGANLSRASLNGCDLRGTSLLDANLDGLRITGTSIRGTVIGGSHLRSLVDRCMGCDLRGIDLHGQDLQGIVLSGADLRGANLRNANLRGARFEGVDLRQADISGADLTNVELNGCDLSGVDLGSAKTSGMTTNDSSMQSFSGLASAQHQLVVASRGLDVDAQRLSAAFAALSNGGVPPRDHRCSHRPAARS